MVESEIRLWFFTVWDNFVNLGRSQLTIHMRRYVLGSSNNSIANKNTWHTKAPLTLGLATCSLHASYPLAWVVVEVQLMSKLDFKSQGDLLHIWMCFYNKIVPSLRSFLPCPIQSAMSNKRSTNPFQKLIMVPSHPQWIPNAIQMIAPYHKIHCICIYIWYNGYVDVVDRWMNRANLMFIRASWEFGVLGWGLSVYVVPSVQHYVYSGVPWFNKEPAFLISMWMCLFAVPELRQHTAGLFLFMCSSSHCQVLEPFPPLIVLAYCLVPLQHIAIV